MKSESANATSKVMVRKPYVKPTLAKGPVLSDITAQPATSPGGRILAG